MASRLVFCYGSLMHPHVWARVTGQQGLRVAHPAYIEGYARHPVTDATAFYPAIRATGNATDRVYGLAVVISVDDFQTVALLDRYETELYRRESVMVHILNAADTLSLARLPALVRPVAQKAATGDARLFPPLGDVYVWAADRARMDETTDWDYDAFVRDKFGMFEADLS
ncbi:hypothetical protein BC828DRAFT_402765 [Blastocladiella britannica]|nr:hypothetical protein BC828DRAFT_402765 [Blastocladiella britannica]